MTQDHILAGVAQWQSRSFPSYPHPQFPAGLRVNRAKNGHAGSIACGIAVNNIGHSDTGLAARGEMRGEEA
jgi:hypothetical protein